MANTTQQANEMLEAAISWLQGELPVDWTIEGTSVQVPGGGMSTPTMVDSVVELRSRQGAATIVVEAKANFSPRDAEQLLSEVGRRIRALSGNQPLLVVSDWLSQRTQTVLRERQINYIDLTGNALIHLDYPAVFIRTTGATRNPAPTAREPAALRGPRAARLMRTLVDVTPPYGVKELSEITGLTAGYVSRLLQALDNQALITRRTRGPVSSVDIEGVLRRWSDSYEVLKANRARQFVAPEGLGKVVASLAKGASVNELAVTGSFAAVRRAPVAAPTLLMVYTTAPDDLAVELRLLPADVGANVVLLEPFDPIVWERTESDQGIRYVAASQVVADCLKGPGRMPSEGEALLRWLLENETSWRSPAADRTDD